MGRHQNAPSARYASRRRPSRGRGVALASLAGALVLAVIIGIGAYVLVGSKIACDGTTHLSVAAAPDIAQAVRTVAADFNGTHDRPGEQCVQVTVSAQEPVDVFNALSGSGPVVGKIDSDVWIPDSSLWVDLVRSASGGAGKIRTTGTNVAESPVIMAVSRALADADPDRIRGASWRSLVPAPTASAAKFDAHMLDPTHSASGMGALLAIHDKLGNGDSGLAALTAVVRRLQNRTAPDANALFGSFVRPTDGKQPVLVTSEQSVWSHNDASSAYPAVGVYPSDGSYYLDYPYVLTTKNSKRMAAAQAFRSAVTSKSAREELQNEGFRSPDGKAGPALTGAPGMRATAPHKFATPSPGTVDDVLQAWKRLMLGTRTYALLDVSGSMTTPIPGSDETRMQAMAKAAQEGLGEFPDSDEVGVRLFSTNMDGMRDWKEVVPIGPMSAKINGQERRDAINSALAGAAPNPDGNTGLYDSIFDAYKSLTSSYQPDKVNSIMVFTDGREDDPNGMSLTTLLQKLHKEFDPDRPVSVFAIGIGPDIDPSALEKIAAATNGDVYVTQDPTQIRQVFLQAVSRRICSPNCPK